MKQKRNLILTILVAALVIGLLVWRLWPRSLESLSGLDFDRAVSVSAYTESTKYLTNTNTDVFIRHRIDDEDTRPGGEYFTPLLTSFKAIKCRPSLTNLLRPWLFDSFSWAGSVDFLYGFVSCGDSASRFELTNRGELIVNSRLYFITDEEQFTALWDYVTTHGTENKS